MKRKKKIKYSDKHYTVFKKLFNALWDALPKKNRTPKMREQIRQRCWGRATTFMNTPNVTFQNQKPKNVDLTLFKEIASYLPFSYKHSERLIELMK